ncbi:MBG domain-containing protein [Fibrobacter succinogenes]|uniref:MBG domain-containing protein n=1 Tax=Fibrobacter succinogenes TaxID=833 RepID=UPI0026EA3418|nr:MBG domain-containing protein [Fibrobacter succinogenes]
MTNHLIHSLRSLRLGLVLVFTLLMAATSLAEDVINIEAMGQTINKETTWENCSVNIIGNGTVTFSRRIYIRGSVTLNLGAQTTLDAQNGIGVHDGHSLTITGEGNLNTRSGSSNENSPLGGSKGNGIANAGSITILGGNITAINTGSLSYYFGAAIGGAELGSGGNITIRGGTVNAISDSGSKGCKGAGIGGGFNGNAGTITITGGVVKATSGTYGAAAIGGGTINESGKGKGGSITISGGQVTAVSLRGNGIGPGRDGSTREGTAGTISLSWTESTDFINANSYRGDISIEGDSRFYYEGSTDLVLADELAKRQNQKIIPVELDNNSIALANLQMQDYSILPNGAIKYTNYDVYDYNGNKLIKGTHYTETVRYSVDATGAMEEGKLMLTIKGKSPYFGSQSFIMWVNTAVLTQDGDEKYVTIPEKRKMTLKITESEIKDGLTSFKVYEAGGKNHVLGKEWDGVLVINIPDNSNYLIQLSGKALAADRTSKNDLIDCELIYEGYLTVYDNDEASGTILLENSELIYDYLPSPVAIIPTITSTGKNLAIRYREMYGYSDLDLSVTLVPADRKYNVNLPDRFTGGQVTANLRQAKANDNITLTVTPDEGYMLNELRVVKADGETVNVTDCNWYTDWSETISKTVTFKMPTQNVTVAAVFTNKLNSDEGGLYVNMPHSGTKNMVIPDNITSFKLYDDGGKDGDFQPLSDGTLAITAPSGKVMQFSGKSFMVDNSSSESYYAIYNDPPKSYGQKLAYGNQQKEETLYPVVSEGNTAYVRLKAADISRTDFFHKYGLDLNVKVFTPAVYSVSSDKNMEHGNVMFDKTQVVTNGTINVTVSSDEGYVLKDIDAFDADGKIVMTKPDAAQWGDVVYYAASTGYSFKMRSSDATVTPTFMPKTDFFVNMPKTGQRDIIIQDDMTSFRVYDNSGKDGYYFTNDDGKLLLTAPEDCMMKVSGYVKLMYSSAEEDYLDIYDGSSTNAKRLGRFRGYKNSSTTSVTASSSTNQMLLHFISNGYGYVKDGGGVYLTVSVIKRFTSSDITVAAIEDQTYTGSRICPAISVTDGEKVLEPGVDFTTQCSNNISVGTASMTITGKGHYTGGISKQFKIAKAPLMVIAKDKSIIYGDKPANAGVEYSGFVSVDNENSLSGSIVFSYDYAQYDKVGEYAIMPSGLESNNYEIEFVAGKLTVEPKEISIAWDDKETSFTYNGKAQAPNATAGGLLNNDECNIIIDSAMNVGKYSAEAIDLTNKNYKLPENRDGPDFEITKAPLTVTAKNATIAYGDEPSNAGVEYSGFVGDDNENDLNDSIVFNYDYAQFDKVGKYVIIPGGLSSDNYDITFVKGELTVEPKEISIAWSDASLTYNGSEQIPMATANGVENSDECIFTMTGAATKVGKYTAKVTDLSNENYKLPATGLEQAFEITKAPLKITALNDTIVYGDEPASAGIAYDGFVGKETSNVLTGELAFEINYKQYGDAGEYAITPSGLTADNYEIEFVAGKLTVEPKAVSIAWGQSSFAYNGAAQVPTATAEGLLNSDKCGLTVAGAATNVGKYTATVTGLNNRNYKLPATGLEQSFEIAKIPLTVTAKNATIVYGDEPSNAGVEFSGFVGEDNEKSLNGSLIYSYDYKQYGDVGEYTITPSGLTADNYEIEFVAGKLSVEPKAVSIAWGKSSFAYNGAAQVPTATAEGLVNSDKCGLTVAGAATDAGKYTATVTGLDNKNYKLPESGLEQPFEILKADPTIVKAPAAVENLVYNGKAQTLVTAGEAKNGTLVYKIGDAEKYSETLPAATDAGDYTVYFMVLGDENYNDLKAETLAASIAAPASSSSAPASSSSSVKASSSSAKPASSSSSVKASSSSAKPASSSSSVKASSSSSGKNSIAAPAIAKALKVVYSQNQLFVTNPAASDMEVLVFDVQGNLKTRYRAYSAGEHQVSLQQLNQGVYIVRVETRGAVETLQVRVK